jgi:hypothetical protein
MPDLEILLQTGSFAFAILLSIAVIGSAYRR